ncbi:MAG: isoaspartyl peptidase/L-asparaginase [Sphingomonas sp.]|uniref:isoaspartyl peptidase/L-asparaginase family protein n=1 Tax=Sphingomonas sp. TaxID=28214 RepID=UPI00120C4E7E|nr:isoaspartyl peptidase/L-asparaginase [Sphingomonas sp.]THD35558.1 MAG: isoaspartyl peptidase/L-asparaginase [Sphingomonas sp.]
MTTSSNRWSLVIHGGAGAIARSQTRPETDRGLRAALNAALDAGSAILSGGGASLDAVEAAVRVLEDDPHFNAGRGSALTYEGATELDAAIMSGADLLAGSVAGVTATKNPVTLARAVMEESAHVLLGREGADQFSVEHGLEQADAEWFAVPERRRQLEELLANGGKFDVDMKYGTVGAVALDQVGHIAAATSTGGVTGKRWGRIGDSPLIGAGTYADDRGAAVSCTGAGEFFIRESVAFQINARVRFLGESLKLAADTVMAEVKSLGGTGGVIVTDAAGGQAWSFTTASLYRGRAGSDGERFVALYDDED